MDHRELDRPNPRGAMSLFCHSTRTNLKLNGFSNGFRALCATRLGVRPPSHLIALSSLGTHVIGGRKARDSLQVFIDSVQISIR